MVETVTLEAVFGEVFNILSNSPVIPFFIAMAAMMIGVNMVRHMVGFNRSSRYESVYHLGKDEKGNYVLKEGEPKNEFDPYKNMPSIYDDEGNYRYKEQKRKVDLTKKNAAIKKMTKSSDSSNPTYYVTTTYSNDCSNDSSYGGCD